METTTDKALEIFSGFNTTDPDKLLAGLMKLFKAIGNAKTAGRGVESPEYVLAILNTTEFVVASKPELEPRLNVVRQACLDKLQDEYEHYPGLNRYLKQTLVRYGRVKK